MCLYVRELDLAEGRKLQSLLRSGRNRIEMRRAQVVLASAQGGEVPEIARRFYYSPQHVRTLVKDLNADGFKALEPKYGGGRPKTFTDDPRSLIVETALCPPDLLGQPFRRWSLSKLRDSLVAEKIVESISLETIRQTLKVNKVRLRRTKTWKQCHDPKPRSKKNESAGT